MASKTGSSSNRNRKPSYTNTKYKSYSTSSSKNTKNYNEGYPKLSYTDNSSSGKSKTGSSYSRTTAKNKTASGYSQTTAKSKTASGYSQTTAKSKTTSGYSRTSAKGKTKSGYSQTSGKSKTGTGSTKTANTVNRGKASASQTRKRRSSSSDNFMVLRLLILVVLVLIVFEGRLIITMFSQKSGNDIVTSSASNPAEIETDSIPSEDVSTYEAPVNEAEQAAPADNQSGGTGVAGLAGLSSVDSSSGSGQEASAGSTGDDGSVSEQLSSSAVVQYIEPPVDDSYFRDAVFIGDSRMEGFRNTSGITQGTFLTSVGMSLSAITDTKVSSPDGEITVYQGLSGRQYGKIYLMLGTNDLGYYPWEAFKDNAEQVLEQFHKLQPDAIIYVCGVIYVEGQKISTDYVNNDNVRKVNGYLLEACEELPYCYYLNLNEIFSNGYGALIDGATADGVHLQPQYSSMMLDYLKSHYLEV